jgi:diguanylate cyclase (GGDEF)-like protein/PAS domain S-box-containing protein
MLGEISLFQGGDSRLVALAAVSCFATVVAIVLFYRARASRRHLDAALRHMSQGLSMFDADQRLIVCNRRYAEMFGLQLEDLTPGTTLRKIMQLRVESGVFPGTDPNEFIEARLKIARENKPAETLLEFDDGRIFSAVHRPTADGGWLATFEDITDRMHAEGEGARTRAHLSQARADAELAHDRLRDAFDVVPEGLVLFDADDRFVLWNPKYAEFFGGAAGDLKPGVRFEDVLRRWLARGDYPDAVGREEEWLRERLDRHALSQTTYEQALAGDRWVRVDERRTSDGGSIGVRIDITELKRREASFKLLFEGNPLPMAVYDRQSLRFLAVNQAAVDRYGYSRDAFLAMSVRDILSTEDREGFDGAVPPGGGDDGARTARHVKADGSTMDVAVYSRALSYNGRDAFLVAAIDMTERMAAEKRIQHLARFDALTDLPNRAFFNDHLAATLQSSGSSGGRFAVLGIDLDYFKQANDVFGHGVGDALLRALADRLRAAAAGAFLARVGSDEFMVISAPGQQPANAAALAERLLATVDDDFIIHEHHLRLGLTIGVAVYPTDGTEAETLVANAGAALYRAKAEGRQMVRFFEPEMDERLRAQRTLHYDLRLALERGELSLHYQPQAQIAGAIFGFEALIRWRHAKRGMVPPGAFIPLAEEHGLIGQIGEWVLREACREAASWRMPLQLAINLSPLQFRHGDLPALVHDILIETRLPPDRLELEITEGVLIDEPVRVMAILRRLKTLGVKIAMDDFGTGYSSLSSLQSFPFDKIKIDRRFVSGVDSSGQSAAIVRAVIGLGHGLEMPVIAEGVETESQRAALMREGCDEIQGYLIGRPLPIKDYVHLTRNGDQRTFRAAG